MRLHNFFIEEVIGDRTEFVLDNPGLFHQLRNVFRLNVGSQMVLLDNSGFEYLSQVTSFARGSLSFQVLQRRKNKNMPEKNVFLFQSIIKKDKFEWVLEKGTELGVSYFIPLLSERCEKKNIDTVRGKKIIKEAGEQSGRGKLPELLSPLSLDHVLKDIDMFCIAFDGEGSLFNPSQYAKEGKIAVFIGPEGGWSPVELNLFKEKHIPTISLGNSTLRSETASLAVLSLLLLS